MPQPNWYACVNFGEWISEPGPLPARWTSPTGDIYNMGALTSDQRGGLGWRDVVHNNWRDIDENIEQRLTPSKSLVGNIPHVTWDYQFTPGARLAMMGMIDAQAEAIRQQAITSAPGQVMEYDEAYRQATIAIGTTDPISEGDFPFLDADIGVTNYGNSGRKCLTVTEAAQVVVGARDAWANFGAAVRKLRLKAKNDIATAETDAQAFEIYSSAWDTLGSIL